MSEPIDKAEAAVRVAQVTLEVVKLLAPFTEAERQLAIRQLGIQLEPKVARERRAVLSRPRRRSR